MGRGNKPQNYTKSEYERADNEWYVEPPWCVEALADTIPFRGVVYDPACGMGTIPEVFRARGYQAYGTDLVNRGYANLLSTGNFLTDDSWPENDLPINVVTNPPFNLSVEFVQKALSIPGVHKVAIIQQLRFLASIDRFNLFTAHPPTDVLILSRRPSMPPGTKIAEMQAAGTAFKGGAIDYAWFVWDTDRPGAPTQLRWLNPPK